MKINNAGVLKEYKQLREYVSKQKAEFEVADLLAGKKVGDVELLWNLNKESGGYDVIRLYRDGENRKVSMDISYYCGTHLIPGKEVVRRFIGHTPGAFRADTVDVRTGELLEIQGTMEPTFTGKEEKVLKEWHIAS